MIYNLLFDWQKKIVDSFKEKQAFGLFLDMGLGKTPIALAFAEQNNCTKVIIITINAKATENENDDYSWLWWSKKSDIKYQLNSKHTDNFSIANNDVFIINYESLFSRRKKDVTSRQKKVQLRDNINNFILSCRTHNVAIIVDESHKMKTLSSQQTLAIFQLKSLLKLAAKNVYTYLLTGTPFTTGYIDLYSQLSILGYEKTKTYFKDQYCELGNVPGLLGWQQPIVGYKNIDDLYKTIHRFAITIKSEEVIELPEKIFVPHLLKHNKTFDMFTTEYTEGYNIVAEEKLHDIKLSDGIDYNVKKKMPNPYFRNIAAPDLKWLAETNGTFWMRARQLSIGFQGNASESIWYDRSRLSAIKEFLEMNEDNYVIFYNYTPELFELFDICDELGYNIDVYCGDIKYLTFYNKFKALSQAEKLTSKKNVIIANFASGSTGMNWQEYNKCIICSLPLYKDYEQALKRIHRINQKETVIYHIFYQNNWLDIGMKKALDESKQYNEDMFNSDLNRVQDLINKNN